MGNKEDREVKFKNGKCIICGKSVKDVPMCFTCVSETRGNFILVKAGKFFKARPNLRKTFLKIPTTEAYSLFKAEIVEPGWGFMGPKTFEELVGDLQNHGVKVERTRV